MVLDNLNNAARYYSMHPLFKKAFQFLHDNELDAMDVGKYELQGMDLFAIISEGTGVPQEEAKMESHRRYIDIQYIVSGTDHMGWEDIEKCSDPSEPYTEERDVMFYADKATSWFNVEAGYFTIFFPNDVHAPMASETEVRKVVLKIAVQV
ncbi:YhcH/YjgK/YiaL family protein [Botryobacter ruber]|uniref:YhcH/YjgK/YiaL family protein n=1 Tax=Botryobacter ruber TaxID=2171629 RepID=UPI000E0C85AC|nr:YhcH/YjgK/YiaL family protein [Botryobacter ruber]